MPGARDESGRFYAGLILAVLAFLVAVEVYGFRHANLFAQEIWTPVGLARLLQFGALYVGAATALLILAPWIFAGLAAILLIVFTAIGVGPIAFLAVIFFLLSAWSLGDLIVGRPPPRRTSLLPPCRHRSLCFSHAVCGAAASELSVGLRRCPGCPHPGESPARPLALPPFNSAPGANVWDARHSSSS